MTNELNVLKNGKLTHCSALRWVDYFRGQVQNYMTIFSIYALFFSDILFQTELHPVVFM